MRFVCSEEPLKIQRITDTVVVTATTRAKTSQAVNLKEPSTQVAEQTTDQSTRREN